MTTTKKHKQPALPASVKLRLDALRKEVRQEAADEAERRWKIARQELKRGKSRNAIRRSAEETRRANALAQGTVRLAEAVRSSYGLNHPISVRTEADSLTAYTDFKSIVIQFPASNVKLGPDGEAVVAVNSGKRAPRKVTWFSAELLGLIYHELGHIRFTVPWANLLDACGYDTNSSILMPDGGHVRASALRRHWNALEDQRMENAVVVESPFVANYLTIAICSNLVPSWPLFAGRIYLDRTIRQRARDAWVDEHGEDSAQAIEQAVWGYMGARTEAEMLDHVVALYVAVDGRSSLDTSSLDTHPDHAGGTATAADGATDVDPSQQPGAIVVVVSDDSDDSDDDGEGGAGSGSGADDDSEDGDGSASGGSDSNDGDSEGGAGTSDADTGQKAHGGGGAGSGKSTGTVQDAIRESVSKLFADKSFTKALNAAAQELTDTTDVDDFERTPNRNVLSPDEIAEAEALASSLELSLRAATAHSAPEWVTRQRRGYIEPVRYRTRQTGDNDYRRDYLDGQNPMPKLTVSMALDVSGSMNLSDLRRLGVAAYATALACRRLGMPCSAFVFDDEASLLFSDRTAAPEWPSSGGFTVPQEALKLIRALDVDEDDNHLVIVMTDGDFGTPTTDADLYFGPNAQVIGLAFGPRADAETMRTKNNFPVAIDVDDLNVIPAIVESTLLDLVG